MEKIVAGFALGCKVNQYEIEAILELFAENGYHIGKITEPADVYIINTCTVTNLGDKKSRQLIRKVKRQNKNAVVVACGCYSQVAPEEIQKLTEVNILAGTKNRRDIFSAVENYSPEKGILNLVSNISGERFFEPLYASKLMGRTRAYLKIQDGCENFCSYCIVPYARGPVRSRSLKDIISELKMLSENGFKEVVLSGIEVASYGRDLKDARLIDVIEKACEVDGIERIRLSSMEPNAVTEEFMGRVSHLDKMCRHFHLSLQSGSDNILKAMNRKYTSSGYLKIVERIRNFWPDAAITTDIIVGFPGETPEDFEESMRLSKEAGFSRIHVFAYSPKKGTIAEKLPMQIEKCVKDERARKLSALASELKRNFIIQNLELPHKVLFETETLNGMSGYTSNYIKTEVKTKDDLHNKILNVRLKQIKNDGAEGVIIGE